MPARRLAGKMYAQGCHSELVEEWAHGPAAMHWRTIATARRPSTSSGWQALAHI